MVIANLSIEVEATRQEAYGQWARFEDIPRFMEGVHEIERTSANGLRWVADVCGKQIEWPAEITEDRPGERLAWESRGGHFNSGRVTFTEVTPDTTRVDLRLEFEPQDLANALVEQLSPSAGQFEDDLQCFKELVEDD